MSELVRIIDDYRDSHGQPSEASVARAIGVSPQAVNSWRRRGIRELPNRDSLIALARLTGLSYERVILPAVLRDVGYLEGDGGDVEAAPMTPAADDVLRHLTPEEREQVRRARQPRTREPAPPRKPKRKTG